MIYINKKNKNLPDKKIENKEIENKKILHNQSTQSKMSRIISVLLVIAMFISCTVIKPTTVLYAKEKTPSKYGILVANAKGKYTFYDWNLVKGEQRVIKKSSSVVMIPLRKICNTFANISYTYDFTSNKATLVNKVNKKKMVIAKGSKVAYLYANNSKKATKVTMKYKMYLDPDSNAAMVESSALSSILSKKTGYKKYTIAKEIQTAGYASDQYAAIIVYDPYKEVSSIPNATKVKYSCEVLETNIKKVTIPEGYSVPQVFKLLVDQGVCASTQALYYACNNKDFNDYDCIKNRKSTNDRCFLLEGYLYPDTYQFYGNTEPYDVLKKIVANTDKKLTKEECSRAEELGYTMEEILTIASIIEKETGKDSERAKVSSVIYNRLNKPMKIQCDCTREYITKHVAPFFNLDVEDEMYKKYAFLYNTMRCSALPIGPITNP